MVSRNTPKSLKKSSAFLRRPQKCAQSSLGFWNLLSKRQNHEDDCPNFYGLFRKAELYESNWNLLMAVWGQKKGQKVLPGGPNWLSYFAGSFKGPEDFWNVKDFFCSISWLHKPTVIIWGYFNFCSGMLFLLHNLLWFNPLYCFEKNIVITNCAKYAIFSLGHYRVTYKVEQFINCVKDWPWNI